jgi:hypothetical protein
MAEKAKKVLQFNPESHLRIQHLSRNPGELYQHEERINRKIPLKNNNGLSKKNRKEIMKELHGAMKRERRRTREEGQISGFSNEEDAYYRYLRSLNPQQKAELLRKRAELLHAEELGINLETSRQQNRALAESQFPSRIIRPPVYQRVGRALLEFPSLDYEVALAQDAEAAAQAAAEAAAQAEERAIAMAAIAAKAAAAAEQRAIAEAEAKIAADILAEKERERKQEEEQLRRRQHDEDELLYKWYAKHTGKQISSIKRSAKQLDHIKKIKESKGGRRTRKNRNS